MSRYLRACEAEDMLAARLQMERERERQRKSYLSGNSLYQVRVIGVSGIQQANPQSDNKPKLNKIG